MSLDAYLARLNYEDPVRPDLQTLFAIHRAHLAAIPYENLEIQLGRENKLSEAAFEEKLVRAGRGGWCYENNGLLTSALRKIGFAVTRVAGGVGRNTRGDSVIGNHLVGLVDLERRYVVDVGLGDGPLDPFPLAEREWAEGDLHFRLERLDADWWRFHNHAHGLASTFDFTEQPRELDWFQDQCTQLQTDDHSPFVGMAMVIRRTLTGVDAMMELTRIRVVDGERSSSAIDSRDDYVATLKQLLDHDLGTEAVTLWEKISARVRQRAEASAALAKRQAKPQEKPQASSQAESQARAKQTQ